MAKAFPNTPRWAAEASTFTTAVSHAFEAMLKALSGYIEAERDLDEVGGAYDPSYAHWLRDAELAHERLTTALVALRETTPQRAEDRLLLRLAEQLDEILGSEERAEARQLMREMRGAFWTRYQLRSLGPIARQYNAFALEAVHLAQAMITLDLYASSEISAPAPLVAAAA